MIPEHGRFADDAQRYALVARIATGGMGEVWRGRDTVLGRTVAVKVLKAEYADDPRFRQRFETEAQHAASLHHPGIAGVFDFGEASPTDGSTTPRPYLVMELVEGQPLSDLLRPGAPMDPDVVADLMAQAADAVGAAHVAGIVHRDVKPGNLIITPDRRVKVTDFGIARAARETALTETGQVLGTPAYLSPEQAEGGVATAASDVYGLGVVAFECLAGRRPFAGETPVATAVAHLRQPVPELPVDVPPALAAVVTRALAKDPEERYADGSALAAALRDPASLAGGGGPATFAPPAHVAPPPPETRVLSATPVGGGPATSPPTHNVAPPAPERTDPPPQQRDPRSGAWLPWAILAVVVLVGGLVLWQLLADGDDTTDDPKRDRTPTQTAEPTQTETSEPAEEPATVEVDEGDYLGADVSEVEQTLRDLGLEVARDRLDNPGDEAENAVAGVDPSGTLAEGDRVTVSYWGPPPETPTDEPPSETPTQTPTDPAETATQTPTQSSSQSSSQSPAASDTPTTQ